MDIEFWLGLLGLIALLLLLAWDLLWIAVPVLLLVGGILALIQKRLRITRQRTLSGSAAVRVGWFMIVTVVLYVVVSFAVLYFVIIDYMGTPYMMLMGPSKLDTLYYLMSDIRAANIYVPLFPLSLLLTILQIRKGLRSSDESQNESQMTSLESPLIKE